MAASIRTAGRFGYLLSTRLLLSSRRHEFGFRFSVARCLINFSKISHGMARSFCISTRTVISSKLEFPDLDVIGGKLVGKNGKNIQRLVAESGYHWEAAVKNDHVYIEGPEYAIVKIAEEIINHEVERIRKVIHDERQFTQNILIDSDYQLSRTIAKMFIGKERTSIDRLKRETGVDIDIGLTDRHVSISGSDCDSVKRATERVQSKLQELRNHIPDWKFVDKVFVNKDVDITQRICRKLIGKRGMNIDLLVETGVHVVLPRYSSHITIRGCDPEAVRNTTYNIAKSVKSIRTGLKVGTFVEKVYIDMNIDDCYRIKNMFIGKNGVKIKEIENEAEVNISVSDHHVCVSGDDNAVVKRTAEKVNKKIQELRKKVKTGRQFKESVFVDTNEDICSNIFKMFVGKKGANINQYLTGDTGVDMNVHISGRYVSIAGDNEDAVRETAEKVTKDIQAIRNYLQEKKEL